MALNVNDVVRVTARMNFGGLGLIQNVYHVQVQDASIPNDEDFKDAVSALLDLAYGQFNTYVVSTLEYVDIDMFNITQDVPLGYQTWDTLTAGISGNDALPLQAAALVVFPTNGKKSVGRKYLSGIEENQSANGGKLTPLVQTAIGNYGVTLVIGTAVGGATILFGNYRPLTATFLPWVGSGVRDYFRTQRRRVLGVGV